MAIRSRGANPQGESWKGSKTRGSDQCGQATKGVWGMSWHQKAKKGVENCEKSGGAVKRVLIPECPNQPPLNA